MSDPQPVVLDMQNLPPEISTALGLADVSQSLVSLNQGIKDEAIASPDVKPNKRKRSRSDIGAALDEGDYGEKTPKDETKKVVWTTEEEEILLRERGKEKPPSYKEILTQYRDSFHATRTDRALAQRYSKLVQSGVVSPTKRHDVWTSEEEALLREGFAQGLSWQQIKDTYADRLNPTRTPRAMAMHYQTMTKGDKPELDAEESIEVGKKKSRGRSRSSVGGSKGRSKSFNVKEYDPVACVAEVKQWVAHFQLESNVFDTLLVNGFNTLSILRELEDADLTTMGITEPVSRTRTLDAVTALRENTWSPAQLTEGGEAPEAVEAPAEEAKVRVDPMDVETPHITVNHGETRPAQ